MRALALFALALTAAPAPTLETYNAVERLDFNKLAVEVALPLFWYSQTQESADPEYMFGLATISLTPSRLASTAENPGKSKFTGLLAAGQVLSWLSILA